MKITLRNVATFILTFVLMFTFSFSVVQATEKPQGLVYGKVIEVHEGNSFTLLTQDNKRYTFKISGIDTSDNPDAYPFLKGYLKGKNARVSIPIIASANTKPYSYGIVYIGSQDIAKDMLASGFASLDASTCDSDNLKTYTSYENSAKYQKVGIWK